MERTDHCVSSLGLVFRVLYTTSATCSSVLDRGAPERSSSCKPWSPFSRKRRRHLPTVARVTPTAAATASLGQPSAASRLISARRTNPWERLRDLAIDSNRSRSDGLSSNGGNGRPVTIGLSFQKGDKRNLRHLQLFVQLIIRQDTREGSDLTVGNHHRRKGTSPCITGHPSFAPHAGKTACSGISRPTRYGCYGDSSGPVRLRTPSESPTSTCAIPPGLGGKDVLYGGPALHKNLNAKAGRLFQKQQSSGRRNRSPYGW